VLAGLGLLREQGRLPAVLPQSVYLCPQLAALPFPAAVPLQTAAGDSAGGNLVLTALGLLREQGRLAALPSPSNVGAQVPCRASVRALNVRP
jgi:acetyl esterase/lipase